jgi:hypothetical protein
MMDSSSLNHQGAGEFRKSFRPFGESVTHRISAIAASKAIAMGISNNGWVCNASTNMVYLLSLGYILEHQVFGPDSNCSYTEAGCAQKKAQQHPEQEFKDSPPNVFLVICGKSECPEE